MVYKMVYKMLYKMAYKRRGGGWPPIILYTISYTMLWTIYIYHGIFHGICYRIYYVYYGGSYHGTRAGAPPQKISLVLRKNSKIVNKYVFVILYMFLMDLGPETDITFESRPGATFWQSFSSKLAHGEKL